MGTWRGESGHPPISITSPARAQCSRQETCPCSRWPSDPCWEWRSSVSGDELHLALECAVSRTRCHHWESPEMQVKGETCRIHLPERLALAASVLMAGTWGSGTCLPEVIGLDHQAGPSGCWRQHVCAQRAGPLQAEGCRPGPPLGTTASVQLPSSVPCHLVVGLV